MKQNDWIVATLNNPTFGSDDFKDIGLNLDNTQILPIDEYLKSDYIKTNPNFQDETGKFQESKFKEFYNQGIEKFKDFALDENYQAFSYDLFDPRNDGNKRVKSPDLKMYSVSNPLHQTIGTAGVTSFGIPQLTAKEQAQKNKVFDPSAGKFEDYSPNDYALFKNPLKYFKSLFTMEPLVYAQYEEDGFHIDPITKQEVEHKAGDFKLNEDGEYYTEKLQGRNPGNKTFVSAFDTITVDESYINKYDFFDADSADKSVFGSIMNTAATVAPLFLGPEMALVYSSALIGRELAKALPMLGGFIDMVAKTDISNNSLFNGLSGKAQQLTGGTSEYSTQNQLTFENISKIVGDVATQWGQQKAIAKGINKLRNSNDALQAQAYKKAADTFVERASQERLLAMATQDKKLAQTFYKNTGLNSLEESALADLVNSGRWTDTAIGKAAMSKYMKEIEPILERQSRIGANTSLAYMAIISNTDVYQDMLNAGATKGEAALVALGSTLGMYAVDRSGLGELFFDDLTAVHTKEVRVALRDEMKAWQKSLTQIIKNPDLKGPNKMVNLINEGRKIGKKVLTNYWDDVQFHSTGFIGKAIGEGLEEVSEEVVSDLAKQFYEIGGSFNIFSQKDVGAWKDGWTRYGMSFLGGALGGGIFYGAGVVNGQYPLNINSSDITYLARNGRIQEVKDQIADWKRKGKFGSTVLSATKYEEDAEGNKVYLTADSREDSQNDFIANKILDSINQVDAIINGNQVNLSEDELFDQMILSEVRYNDLRSWLQDQSYSLGYQQEFQNIVDDLVTAQTELNYASQTKTGTVTDQNQITDPERRGLEGTVTGQQRAENLEQLQNRVNELKERRDKFISGDTSLWYTRKMLFALDSSLSARFTTPNFKTFVEQNHHKTLENLTEAEYDAYKEEYSAFRDSQKRQKLDEEFSKFLALEPVLAPVLTQLEENSKDFNTYAQNFGKVQEILNVKPELLKIDSPLEGDTEEYLETLRQLAPVIKEISKKPEEEYTPEDLEAIGIWNPRAERINIENDKILQQRYDEINELLLGSDGKIDPITFRNLWRQFDVNLVERKNAIISEFYDPNKFEINITGKEAFTSLLMSKLPSLTKENKDEVLESLFGFIEDDINQTIQQRQSWERALAAWNGDDNSLTDFKDRLQPIIKETQQNEAITEDDLGIIKESVIKDAIQEALGENASEDAIEYLYNLVESTEGPYTLGAFDVDTLVTEQSQQAKEDVGRLINDIVNKVDSDIHISEYKKLKDSATKVNPFLLFIKKALTALGEEDAAKVEEVLQQVFNEMENLQDKNNFRLTPEQIELFIKTRDILELIEGYLYAASSSSTILTPYGHNKTINAFYKNHKDAISNFNELPELSDEAYQLYLSEFSRYGHELSVLIDLSNQNQINKVKKFQITDEKFVQARIKFFDVNKDAFIVTFSDGKTYNLLDGMEKLTPGSNPNEQTIYINQIEQLLYDNIQQLIAKGYSFKQLLEESKLIEKIAVSNGKSNLDKQSSAKLNENIDYDSFTNYDKVVYFLTVASLSVSEWNKFNKEQITKYSDVVPLTIQQYVSRIAIAKYDNPSIFKTGLRYLADSKLIDENIIALNNITFITGIAGSGKSSICAKWVVDWAEKKGIKSDDIWLTAPKEKQRKNLKASVIVGNSLSKADIFKKLFNIDLVKDYVVLDEKDYKKRTFHGTGEQIVVEASKIKLTTTELPNLIVVDEGTHFSNSEYQILNTLGIEVIILGDPNQLGYSIKGNHNIDREFCFITRTPKIDISLRDNNLQNQENQQATSTLLTDIQTVDGGTPEAVQKSKDFIKAVGNLHYRIYNGDEINGTLITSSLSSDILDRIPQEATIGFIGGTDSAAYKKIVEAGFKNIEDFGSVSDVQGQEFDYVFVNDQIRAIEPDKDPESLALSYFNTLQQIYTAMTRGKVASVFIDPYNTLTNITGANVIDGFKATAPNLKEAAEVFRGPFMAMLDQLIEQVVPKTTEQTTPEEEKEEVVEEEPVEDLKGDEEDFDEPGTEPRTTDELVDEEEQETEEEKVIRELELSKQFLNNTAVYSEISLVGVPVEGHNINGKRVQSWEAPTGQKRDIGIFMDYLISEDNPDGSLDVTKPPYKDHPETVYAHRNFLITSLKQLKSALLFKSDYATLPDVITKRFTEEDLQKVKYKLEVRKADKKNGDVVTGSGTITELETFNGVLILVIAELKNNKGETVTVTMGTISNPQTQIDRKEEFVAGLNASIDRLNQYLDTAEAKGTLTPNLKNAIEERKQLLKQRIADNDKINQNYQAAVQQILENFESNGSKPMYHDIDIENSQVTSTQSVKNKSGEPLSLDILTKDYQGKILISKPYIVAGDMPGVSPKMKGKAVVFVSAENSRQVTSDVLVHDYMAQRYNMNDTAEVSITENSTPKVRMLALTSRGYTLEQLLRRENPKDTPFEWGVVGRKMLVSTWNFRANLITFLEKYNNTEFSIPEGLDKDEYIDKVALAQDALYRISKSTNDTEKQQIFETIPEELLADDTHLTPEAQKVADEINEFNNSLATEVKDFRIGGSVSGQYIRKLTNIQDGNQFYNKDKGPIYGIYINISRAKKFKDLLDATFDMFSEVITLKNETTGENLSADYIISGKDKSANNINNYDKDLYQIKTGKIILGDGISVDIGVGQQHAVFSAALLSVLRKVWHSQQVTDELEEDGSPDRGVRVELDKGGPEPEVIKLNLFDIYSKLDTAGDYSLSDMFNLILHGTTEDIIKHPKTPKAYSAYFKKGIMMHPVKVEGSGLDFGTHGLQFFEAANPSSMFLLDRIPTDPIFRIKTKDIEDFSKGLGEKEPTQLEELRNSIPLQFQHFFDDGIGTLENQNDPDEIQEFIRTLVIDINNETKKQLTQAFTNNSELSGKDTIIEVKQIGNTITYKTLNQFLKENGITIFDNYKIDDSKIIIDDGTTSSTIIYDAMNNEFKIDKGLQSSSDSEQSFQRLKDTVSALKNYNLYPSFVDTLENFENQDALKAAIAQWLADNENEIFEYGLELEDSEEFDQIIKELSDNCAA